MCYSMDMKSSHILALLCVLAGAAQAVSVFEMPQIQARHEQLKQLFVPAYRAGDTEKMEEISRAGVELMPDDPTWRYNLACALAYKANKDEAFAALDKAIELGFNDRKTIAADNDMRQLAADPRFALLLKKADVLRNNPKPGKPVVAPLLAFMGVPATVSATNTVWNLELGRFQTFFDLQRPAVTAADIAARYNGPAKQRLQAWLKEGTAASNYGDLYVNHDGGHSVLTATNFPGLTPILYSAEARAAKADVWIPNMLFPAPVIGNCSMSVTQGAYWRSLPRMLMSEPAQASAAGELFLNSQQWFYPAHRDWSPETGDLFPANAPFFVVSRGSSFTDKPFMEAFAASLAALAPDTKALLVRQRLLMPTLQMAMRRTLRTVKTPDAYLTGAAHPVVFDGRDLDADAMVAFVHGLKPKDVPPFVLLKMNEEPPAKFGVDFFDVRAEPLFDSPFCVARVSRGMARERAYTIAASAFGAEQGTPVSFTWRLLQGESDKVKIEPLNASGSLARITVAYHGFYLPKGPDGLPAPCKTGRVDIGCFAKTSGGAYWSMPSMFCVCFPPSEVRVYRDDGRIQSVDYTNPNHVYADPMLTIQKNWKDFYNYDAAGHLLGWFRKRGGTTERFTWTGHKVVSTDKLDRPLTACAIEYIPRQEGPEGLPPVLSQADTEKVVTYVYSSDADLVGKPEQAKAGH